MISPTVEFSGKFKTLLGIIFALAVTLIKFLSVPVYIFRLVVILAAKLFRPDLGEICNGTNALFVNDYFEKTPPRSNIVVTMVIQGQTTFDEIEHLIMKNWIGKCAAGETSFDKFQQYPVRWCGFTFWKRASDKFCAENHVHLLHGRNGENLSEEELNNIVEKLLNARFPEQQSPWELHIVESYGEDDGSDQHTSVLLLKVHHSLGDGFSLLTALLEGLCESSMGNVQIPVARLPQRSHWKNVLHSLAAPMSGFMDMAYLLSYRFRNFPWKIPDENKKRYQVCARTEPISVQLVKDIKNFYGVSFTSVILSAYSCAIFKSLEEGNRNDNRRSEPMLCLCAVPIPGFSQRRSQLSNQFTAAVYELPTNTKFNDPVERLLAINEMMEVAKKSAIPTLIQYYSVIAGAHFYKVYQILTKNRMISTGLSNFPGMMEKVEFKGKPVVDVDFITGGQEGEAAAAFTTFSYNGKIRLGIAAERALMSRKDAKRFLKCATDEIQLLYLQMKKS